jgi:hypothetical protein
LVHSNVTQSFNPWWRLLHGCIGIQQKFHRYNPFLWPSAVCQTCDNAEEDLYHFAVGCPLKQEYWMAAVQFLNLSQDLTSVEKTWATFITLSSTQCVSLSFEVLSKVGLAFSVLWRYHWQTTLPEQSFWVASVLLEQLASVAYTVDGYFVKTIE